MSKFRIILLAVMLVSVVPVSVAQRVALEERIPKIKTKLWLDGKMPSKARYTYIEFVHSKTVPCIRTFLNIQQQHARFGEDIRAIIVTKENPAQISQALRESVTEYVNVAFDTKGEIFREFRVQYVPFGIVIDHRRRALWFGNPITVNDDFFKKIKTKRNDTH